ncbi:MAG TPA: hypothetical protein VHL57_09095, partial [Flavobacteriales bacterium]|nr:hypothetical protein [Flavobacteriales bacterium]
MRRLYIFFALVLSAIVVWINIAAHLAPPPGSLRELKEVVAQLRSLRMQMRSGLGEDLQQTYPEGSVFAHALYGLAWCGVAARATAGDTLQAFAAGEAKWAYARIDAPATRAPFPLGVRPEHGAFYAGWRNFLLARILQTSDEEKDTAWTNAFERQSNEIAEGFASSPSVFPASYTGMVWPADGTVCMASLALHDRMYGPRHAAVIRKWLQRVRGSLDEGLVPHAWDPDADRMQQPARGCSQALINCFLPMIDSAFAAE